MDNIIVNSAYIDSPLSVLSVNNKYSSFSNVTIVQPQITNEIH